MAVIMGLGLLFHVLLGFRYRIPGLANIKPQQRSLITEAHGKLHLRRQEMLPDVSAGLDLQALLVTSLEKRLNHLHIPFLTKASAT